MSCSLLAMTFPTGGGARLLFFADQVAMATCTLAMKRLSQAGCVTTPFCPMAFFAERPVVIDGNEFTLALVIHMVAGATPFLVQGRHVQLVGEDDRRPLELSKNLPVSDLDAVLLCGRHDTCAGRRDEGTGDKE